MTLATGAAASTGGGGLPMLILALPILLLIWLMFSQRRRSKALAEAQQAVQVGQEVLTTAGIHAVVTGLEHDVVHVRIADGVVVRMDRRAIVPMSMATGRGATGRGATAPGATDTTDPDVGGTSPR